MNSRAGTQPIRFCSSRARSLSLIAASRLRAASMRLGRMVGLGAAALQHQHVIGAEIDHVEAQRRAAVPHRIVEVGAGPVGDRHEIVADRPDAGGGDGADRRLVVVDQLAEAAGAGLDVLVHDDALDDRPVEPAGLDLGLALRDLVERPGAAVIEMVQRA